MARLKASDPRRLATGTPTTWARVTMQIGTTLSGRKRGGEPELAIERQRGRGEQAGARAPARRATTQ